MATTRPKITPVLSLSGVTDWYWLKTDLVAICHVFRLSTSGSKPDLEERLWCHLSGTTANHKKQRRLVGEMPQEFTAQTVITKGWRCTPLLGAYFRSVLGNSFRFNAIMRDFIHNGAGHTLAEAAICYLASVRSTGQKPCIPR